MAERMIARAGSKSKSRDALGGKTWRRSCKDSPRQQIYRARAFSALGPFASKEFRSRPSCAISLRTRHTTVVNAAVSVRRLVCPVCSSSVSVNRWVACVRTNRDRRSHVRFCLLPAYAAFDHGLNLFSARPEVRTPLCVVSKPTDRDVPIATFTLFARRRAPFSRRFV